MSLLVNDDPQILWQETLKEAEHRCSINLDPKLEIYLISLLIRYTDKPDVVNRLFASALFHAYEKSEIERDMLLQRVGDECLLFSGLFPRIVKKRNVSIRYFVDIGRSAYANMSNSTSSLFDTLSVHFVLLMDVLQSIQKGSYLLPLEAYDQWESLRSQRALKILQDYTRNKIIK